MSFARALYRDADIYLLDDPLSAVDAMVGDTLFSEGIMKYLIGRGKTVILVTHQVHLLQNCSNIIVLDGGKIVANGDFSSLQTLGIDLNFEKSNSAEAQSAADTGAAKESEDEPLVTRDRRATTLRPSIHEDKIANEKNASDSEAPAISHKLTTVEDRSRGRVSGSIYWYCCVTSLLP